MQSKSHSSTTPRNAVDFSGPELIWDGLMPSGKVFCVVICVTILSTLTSLALLLWPLSLTSRFLPAEPLLAWCIFCFSHHSLQTVEAVPRGLAVSEILTPPCLAPTIIPQSKSKQLNLIKSACLYAFRFCHMISWLNIWINKLVYRST